MHQVLDFMRRMMDSGGYGEGGDGDPVGWASDAHPWGCAGSRMHAFGYPQMFSPREHRGSADGTPLDT